MKAEQWRLDVVLLWQFEMTLVARAFCQPVAFLMEPVE